jgi:hypothetical protein
VSGLWSSLSAGIANNLLNRSLGLTNEEVARMTVSNSSALEPGAGTNISAGGVIPDASILSEQTNERKRQLADSRSAGSGRSNSSGNDLTLIDDDLETLYSTFQRKRTDLGRDEGGGAGCDTWEEQEREDRKMKLEETKMRALNRNGRVDYSIQE